ncbi:cytidine deaminase [Bacteroides caecigallinarum]|uniref:cytidine deaminase n=1 Tax=Bacteroides caecigallinarum TaxID=1411144 RepID=UPI00195E966D|nr:cytidine deaminase [Bacteroides caecigallinarum]MBM6891174.1 cytidine deaminase [Bacteroides caecigallinarum]MCF2582950.1 cytidine deaminase [Bacteroides caecigallinarum]
MKELKQQVIIRKYQFEELTDSDKRLIEAAKEATKRSYAPYSHFHVGAAAMLDDGTIVTGSNQENAAYPSGLCAERTTLFHAGSEYPGKAVTTLAIAASNCEGFTEQPVTPCGACRQVMLEAEQRYHRPIRMLMYGTACIYETRGTKDLLPLSFGIESME